MTVERWEQPSEPTPWGGPDADEVDWDRATGWRDDDRQGGDGDAWQDGFYRGFVARGTPVCTCQPTHQPGCAVLRDERPWWRRWLP